MSGHATDWRTELERWLEPFLAHLSHPARRAMCPHYVAGPIGPGERKSVQPMADRLGLGTHDRLHHFVSAGIWDAAPSRRNWWCRPIGCSADRTRTW
jgi:SRSO17 transposase